MKALTNWRYYILYPLSCIAILGLFSVPADDCEAWFSSFFISKAIGGVFAYVTYRLAKYWHERNQVPELSKLINEEV